MTPDEFQQAWQTQATQTRVTIAADVLRNEVQRNQQAFQLTILGRDIREVGVGLLMIPVWFFLGAMWSLPWSWYLTVLALLWIVGFIFVDRMRQPRRACSPGEPLFESVQESLAQVEHQIWLLRNIFWWYLLPPTISILAFFFHVAWLSPSTWLGAIPSSLIVVGVYAFIYWLNQFAVRKELEPRRQELLALLASLKDETGDDDSGRPLDKSADAGTIASAADPQKSRNLTGTVAFIVVLAALTALASVAADYFGRWVAGPAKLSPFAAVRWEGQTPVVKVGQDWFTLVALDDIPADEIVAYSRRNHGDLWQKRFEEDLVELLTEMGHEPQKTVRLIVSPPGTSEHRTLNDVAMTKANRQAIRAAAEIRAEAAPPLKLAPEVLKKYEGVYVISPLLALTITLEGEQLMFQATGQEKLRLEVKTETWFHCPATDAGLFFVPNHLGQYKYLVLHQNGVNQTATRQD